MERSSGAEAEPWEDYEVHDAWFECFEDESWRAMVGQTLGGAMTIFFDWLEEIGAFEVHPEILLAQVIQHSAAESMLCASGHRDLAEGEHAISQEAEDFLSRGGA